MVSTQYRYWVYILASQPRGTLYIGVTNNILGRVELHRIEQSNPQWVDLYPGLAAGNEFGGGAS